MMTTIEKVLLACSAIALAGAWATQTKAEMLPADVTEYCREAVRHVPGYDAERGSIEFSGEPYTIPRADGTPWEIPYSVISITFESQSYIFDRSNTEDAVLGGYVDVLVHRHIEKGFTPFGVKGVDKHEGNVYVIRPLTFSGHPSCLTTLIEQTEE